YPGACAVLVAAIVGGIVLKAAGKQDTKRMVGGLFAGMTLCATAGFAELMRWVPEMYNALGDAGRSVLNGEVSL
ncbi:hypothetical protein, partial [Cellulosimicrobium composti]|uniref:hypothetical protein n=2 Tax=Actinomycetota TaxID=201174 RepID=UPI001CECB18F